MIGRAVPSDELDEKGWDAQLFATKDGLAGTLGWNLNYHVLRSKGSQAGFPDRVLARERIVWVETKKEDAPPPSEAQVRWLDGIGRAGGEAYLWRPSDLDECARVLSRRWTFVPWQHDRHPYLERAGVWTPRSLWLPGVGRADAHPEFPFPVKEAA